MRKRPDVGQRDAEPGRASHCTPFFLAMISSPSASSSNSADTPNDVAPVVDDEVLEAMDDELRHDMAEASASSDHQGYVIVYLYVTWCRYLFAYAAY